MVIAFGHSCVQVEEGRCVEAGVRDQTNCVPEAMYLERCTWSDVPETMYLKKQRR
jgi:hypothetical protein